MLIYADVLKKASYIISTTNKIKILRDFRNPINKKH